MKYIIALLLSFTMIGCTTTDPYTGEQKTSKTAKGAGIGAVAGAVLGAATGDNAKDRRERALKGAAIGGVIGGGVGNYMDRQEAKLRAELQGTGVQVRREGNNLYLIMPGNITFATSSADIRSDFFPVLNSVAKVVAEFNQTSIRVTGHTDSTGSDSINQPLSERRADSVAMYLRSQKVASARIQAYGYGSRYPVASNDTPTGREQNRRVELELIPNE
ncbi:OmpA family protein [Cellvibrio japonicus]|uniref:OmpA family protein n=1 Tax=Cellvibrio japonicus (strain Ueda107) TaxID=498211 RepID=B3PC12_CELJU|nr:OmpA family protein [Cellvibrio japonicus]ACE84514.1 OmpA family protein [Cellvibrio japonicus Ueda107]QEI13167.1 OmpA family protein [Cellvibrio japonicus]QEI16741.1 OmpA family protein [Cellvibrio japonicus]QEI20319.1 OmpA family protein [Cellvibrio japonicus]